MDMRHVQDNHLDSSHANLPAHSVATDQPQMLHPTAPVTHPGAGLTGTLRRSGSSSSSEDDGCGGRRGKKGIKDKIKEKLPGGQTHDDHRQMNMVGPEHHEKKGIMEKIKEKLPGSHHNN